MTAPDTRLPPGVRAYLRELPEFIREDDHLYTHISPRDSKQKIDHAIEAWNVFNETPYRRIFVGHVHIPSIFGERSGEFGAARAHSIVDHDEDTIEMRAIAGPLLAHDHAARGTA